MSADVEDSGRYNAQASQVEALAGYGLVAAEIARLLDVDVDALKSNYKRELECGQIKANARVAESLYRKALGEGRESVVAAIFWLKTRANWKETAVLEHSGLPDELITIDLTSLDDETIRQLAALPFNK